VRKLCAACVLALAAAAPARAVDWSALQAAWQEYYLHPSAARAADVVRLLPSERPKSPPGDESADAREFVFDNLEPLAAQVESAEAESVTLGFRLYAIADSRDAVSLDVILSTLLEDHAEVFLRELSASRNLVPDLGQLVSAIGDPDEMEDLSPRQTLRRRIDALGKVQDPKLARLRDECVRALKKAI
jgi:hypothetical protein